MEVALVGCLYKGLSRSGSKKQHTISPAKTLAYEDVILTEEIISVEHSNDSLNKGSPVKLNKKQIVEEDLVETVDDNVLNCECPPVPDWSPDDEEVLRYFLTILTQNRRRNAGKV